MENKIDPLAQSLLDELTERSYLVRQKEIVKLLEPFNDIAIPLLIERLNNKSENYEIRHNAIQVLALSSDYRSILPLLRHIEIETGWTKDVFDYLRQGLREKGDDIRKNANEQLIKYLEEGPKIPTPEPFDPVESENQFNEFIGFLMKKTGVTDLDEETKKLAGEVKEKWVQPPDRTEEEKERFLGFKTLSLKLLIHYQSSMVLEIRD